MSLRELLTGKPIPDEAADEEKLGVLGAVPVLGLDALASAAYGPEAALTVLLPLGAAGLGLLAPVTAAVVALLVLVQLSYRQTIAAYPDGGGTYSVAKANLGDTAALFAAGALAMDYVLNVAVAVSAGAGAVVSAAPALRPHLLALCLALLALLVFVNLRGLRTAGLALLAPTWAFVGLLGAALAAGAAKALSAGGAPTPAAPPHPLPAAAQAAGLWIALRAFASGCTAMTGVEAVSNAVPVFRPPTRRRAQRTLAVIVAVLSLLLVGIAWLVPAYRIGATEPGGPEYETLLSQLVAAVMGRGPFYYAAMAAILAVLCLSANTSFADFPRLCRQLAVDEHLPEAFAQAGARLVCSTGIVVLGALSGVLLVAFRGITDRLIPLFAVGAFSAFARLRRSGRPLARAGRGARPRGGPPSPAVRAPALALPAGGAPHRRVRPPPGPRETRGASWRCSCRSSWSGAGTTTSCTATPRRR
jgi:amino acid transporter